MSTAMSPPQRRQGTSGTGPGWRINPFRRLFGTVRAPWVVAGALLLVAVACLRPGRPPAPRYRCEEIGGSSGLQILPRDLNNRGQVVGEFFRPGEELPRAFLADGTQLRELGEGQGWEHSGALSINDSGRVAGEAVVSADRRRTRVFLFESSSGQLRYVDGPAKTAGLPLGRAERSRFSIRGLGPAGELVGSMGFNGSTGYPRAVLWDETGPRDLGTLGGPTSTALAINRAGWVVGNALTGDWEEHAFLFAGGRMQDLGTLGGDSSDAFDVNDLGQVVGEAALSDELPHAFLYSHGRIRDLGPSLRGSSSVAASINNRGQIVGTAALPAAHGREPRAVLWQNGALYDLNDLCALRPAVLGAARGINDRGQIIVEGGPDLLGGSGYLLTPRGDG